MVSIDWHLRKSVKPLLPKTPTKSPEGYCLTCSWAPGTHDLHTLSLSMFATPAAASALFKNAQTGPKPRFLRSPSTPTPKQEAGFQQQERHPAGIPDQDECTSQEGPTTLQQEPQRDNTNNNLMGIITIMNNSNGNSKGNNANN